MNGANFNLQTTPNIEILVFISFGVCVFFHIFVIIVLFLSRSLDVSFFSGLPPPPFFFLFLILFSWIFHTNTG